MARGADRCPNGVCGSGSLRRGCRAATVYGGTELVGVIGFRPHSALTVRVGDCDGLVEAIGEALPPA